MSSDSPARATDVVKPEKATRAPEQFETIPIRIVVFEPGNGQPCRARPGSGYLRPGGAPWRRLQRGTEGFSPSRFG